ncbi:MAG: Hsp20/alpha crystallin family protein [Candidatus Micrarchaeia archaeon]
MVKMAKKKNGKDPKIDDMEKLNQYLNKVLSDMIENNFDFKNVFEGTPFKYGITIKFDASGMPLIEGAASQMPQKTQMPANDEPLVDIIDKQGQLVLDVSLPGVSSNDIKIESTAKSVHVSASNVQRHYDKHIELPVSVNASTAKATFNNGTLEIVFEKESTPEKGNSIIIK